MRTVTRTHAAVRTRTRAAGFTLLEVLLTLVILAIGLLGLAGMQMVGLKSNGTANYRSIATQVAAEMAERMRINACGVDTLPPRFAAVTRADDAANCNALPNPYCGAWRNGAAAVSGMACTPAQMANYDINVMYCGEAMNQATPSMRTPAGLKLIPGGDMTITCKDNPCQIGSKYTITVTWNERPEGATDEAAVEQSNVSVDFIPHKDPNWDPTTAATPCS